MWTAIAPVIDGSFVSGQIGIARNGIRQAKSIFLLTIKGGVVYASDTDGWSVWTGTTWAGSAAPF